MSDRPSHGTAAALAPARAERAAQLRAYKIVPVTEAPAAALAEFYERMYPARAAFLNAHWRWLYRIGEYGWAPLPLVAISGPTVIGHIGVIPVRLRAGQEVRRAVWDVDLAVLPEYQRQQIGTQLMQVMGEQCPLHVAFGNEKSAGTLTKAGWRLSTQTRSFQLLLHPEYHPKLQHSLLAPVGQLGGLLTRLVWAARTAGEDELTVTPVTPGALASFTHPPAKGEVHVERSPEFLRWRVLRHPLAAEHCILRCRISATVEYALLARRSEQDGFRRLHLLSLQAEPFEADALARCFASIVRWSLAEGIHRLLLVTSNPSIARVAQAWFPITNSLRFLSYASNASGWAYLNANAQHWECLDDDFDLSV